MINALEIVNEQTNKTVYQFKSSEPAAQEKLITPDQLAALTLMISVTNADIDALLKYYKIDDFGKMTTGMFDSAMKLLKIKEEKK